MPTNTLKFSPVSRQRGLMTLLTGMLVAPAAFAVTTTWDGSESNDWLDPLNWDTGNLPTAADNTFIQAGTVSLSGDADTRFLRMGTSGSDASSMTLESGTLTSGGAGSAVLASSDGATVSFVQNGGTFDVNHNLAMGGIGSGGGGTSSYILNAGTLSIESSGRSLLMGDNTTANNTSSTFYQNGGSVIIDSTLHVGSARYTGGSFAGRANTATYEISGGSLTTTDLTMGTDTTTGLGAVNATAKVNGSSATINVNGNVLMNQNANNNSTLSFNIDNGGVSKVNVGAGGTATLAGALEAGVQGSVALTSGNSFTLVEADTGAITNGFSTLPNAALWDVAINDIGGGRDALQLSLAAGAQQASIAAGGSASFGATTFGFAELTGLSLGSQEIQLSFDAGTGLTVGDYISYLASNGIVAAEITEGDYTVAITTVADSETSFFTWDLSGFNSDATISGIYVIPEPSTTVGLMGLSILAMVGLIRRKRS